MAQQLAASEEQVRLLAHKEKELEEIRSELQVLSAVGTSDFDKIS